MLVSVECNNTIDPPRIIVTLADQIPFEVSLGVYQVLAPQLGWPANPCTGE